MTLHIPKEDKEVLIIRKHWYALFTSVFPLALFALFMIVVVVLFGDIVLPQEHVGIGKLFLISSVLLVVWSIAFIEWTNWHLDVWVVTERRIYDVQQLSLFSRDIAELRLERLQDIRIEVRGFIATFLNFGHIHVQSAGESREFSIHQVRYPYKAREVISKRVDEIHRQKPYNI